MPPFESDIRNLVRLATDPVAVVVAPHTLADPQRLADELGVEVREWAGCSGGRVYVRSAGDFPMGAVVAAPRV